MAEHLAFLQKKKKNPEPLGGAFTKLQNVDFISQPASCLCLVDTLHSILPHHAVLRVVPLIKEGKRCNWGVMGIRGDVSKKKHFRHQKVKRGRRPPFTFNLR